MVDLLPPGGPGVEGPVHLAALISHHHPTSGAPRTHVGPHPVPCSLPPRDLSPALPTTGSPLHLFNSHRCLSSQHKHLSPVPGLRCRIGLWGHMLSSPRCVVAAVTAALLPFTRVTGWLMIISLTDYKFQESRVHVCLCSLLSLKSLASREVLKYLMMYEWVEE